MSETTGPEVRTETDVVPPTPPANLTTAKTDIPLPIAPAIVESAETTPAAASAIGDRIISGIDLIDFSAGGLMPNHVYLVKGAGGLGDPRVGANREVHADEAGGAGQEDRRGIPAAVGQGHGDHFLRGRPVAVMVQQAYGVGRVQHLFEQHPVGRDRFGPVADQQSGRHAGIEREVGDVRYDRPGHRRGLRVAGRHGDAQPGALQALEPVTQARTRAPG